MYAIQQNEASAAERRIMFGMVETSTLTLKSNINFVSGQLFLTKNGAAPVTAAGSAVEVASPMSGLYYYQCGQSETDTPGTLSFQALHVSCLPQWTTVQIVRALNVSAGQVEVDIKQINAVRVSGAGTAGNPWGPA